MALTKTKRVLTAVAMASILTVASQGSASSDGHWGYSGDTGAENWGTLSSDYLMCAIGQNQSPIDLKDFTEAELEPLSLKYETEPEQIINNGHSIQLNYKAGSSLQIDGKEFMLKQIHFHSPSENRINGTSFPMEGHLVHASANGELAVISVLYTKGKANDAMAAAWTAMPMSSHEEATVSGVGSVANFLPPSREYYRFSGSLTTPPCSEGVRWVVLTQPAEVSSAQIMKFQQAMQGPNNRPLQPLNARLVLE